MPSLPDLVLPRREFFGLSIDRTSLRGVQVNRKGIVTAFAETTFPPDVFSRSTLTQEDVFVASLTKLKGMGKFTTPYVQVCFPEAFAYTRELTLPLILPQDIHEAVSWHLKDLFPFPDTDLYYDWKILHKTAREYELAVVAVPKQTIDPIVASLSKAGLKPLRLKPDASIIAQLVGLAEDTHAILTEVNRTVAYVTLIEGEKAIFTTVIPFTTDDTPQSYLANVKQTIEEITAYYREKGIIKEKDVEIVLTGEVASDSWIRELPHPSKLLSMPIRNPAFHKAYATALTQMKPGKEEESINLLPPSIQKVYDIERTIQYYKTILFRTSSLIGSYTVLLGIILALLIMRKQELDASVKKASQYIDSQQSVASTQLLSVNGTAKQIVALAPLRKTPRDKLAAFLDLVPDGITITQWEYDDAKILFTISGVADTRETLLEFKTTVDQSPDFTKVSLPLAVLESPRDISFSMSFVSK